MIYTDMLLGRGLKMKKWKKNKSYVYYVPEYDELYVATYKPKGEPWISIKEFREGFLKEKTNIANFNPDILVLMNYRTYEIKCTRVEYVGEL
jgi:hypothetical protein